MASGGLPLQSNPVVAVVPLNETGSCAEADQPKYTEDVARFNITVPRQSTGDPNYGGVAFMGRSMQSIVKL